jgi:hypothetical protein
LSPARDPLQFLRKLRTFFRYRRGVSKGAIDELRGGVEQFADAQVDQDVLACDAIRDVIGDVAVLSVSKFLD